MIRLFTALIKTILEYITDENLFQDTTNGFSHYDKSCPKCGAKGNLSSYGNYSRWLVFLKNKSIFSQRVRPLRFECASCGATHALLPDVIVPYSPYSLRFKLSALIAYYERDCTVVEICERFCIAVSTIYEWKKLFLSHKELVYDASCNLSERLRDFFHRNAFSFLQGAYATSRSAPP